MSKIHGDRVLVETYKASQNSNFILPDEDSLVVTGSVLQVGTSVNIFKPGDKVMYEKHLALPIRLENKDLFILRESDIIITL